MGASPNHTPTKKTAMQKKPQCRKKLQGRTPGIRSGPPQTTPLQKKLRCKKNCNAKKTARSYPWNPLGASPNHTPAKKLRCKKKKLQCKKNCKVEPLESARGLLKPHPCKKNCDAKKTAMQQKTARWYPWNPLGASPNHTPAKKTAMQKKLQCKKTARWYP